ncbi:primase-helicase family protein [Escherichia coli]
MSQQNNQPTVPFINALKHVVNKWKQKGWCQICERSGWHIYDEHLNFVCSCSPAAIRRQILQDMPQGVKVKLPTRDDEFNAVLCEVFAECEFPIVCDAYGVYRPDIPEHFIPEDEWRFIRNLCDVYQTKTLPSPDDINLIQPLLDIWAGLFPNPKERNRVIQFIAHALQKPMEKPSFALLITGAQGNGKTSSLVNVLQTILGETYVTIFNKVGELSTSKGAYRWANHLLCFVDDFYDQTKRTSDNLKHVITQTTAAVKKLYQDEDEIPVITRFIFISNEAQPIIFHDGCDRRFYAPTYAQSQNVSSQVDMFLAKLKTDQRTRDAVYRYLMAYDISDFNPHVPEETENHMRMVGSSTSPVVQQFQAMLGVEPTDFVTKHWYEHMMFDYFGTRLTSMQLDKQWKCICAHLRNRCGWAVSKHIHCSIGGKTRDLVGCAAPNFQTRIWTATVNTLPEHKQARWLMSVAYFESVNG